MNVVSFLCETEEEVVTEYFESSDVELTEYVTNWKENPVSIPGFFIQDYYVTKYLDVYDSGINPLYHFLKYGKKEGRIATTQLPCFYNGCSSFLSNLFDADLYSKTYGESFHEPFQHYLEYGRKESWCHLNFFFKTSKSFELVCAQKPEHCDPTIWFIENYNVDDLAIEKLKAYFQHENFVESLVQLSDLTRYISVNDYSDVLAIVSILVINRDENFLSLFENRSDTPLEKYSLTSLLRNDEGELSLDFFDLSYYKSKYKDLDFENDDDYVLHFLRHGIYEGRHGNYFQLEPFLTVNGYFQVQFARFIQLNSEYILREEVSSKEIDRRLISKLVSTFKFQYFDHNIAAVELFYSMLDLKFLRYSLDNSSIIDVIDEWSKSNFHLSFNYFFNLNYVRKKINSSEDNALILFNQWFQHRNTISCTPLFDFTTYLNFNKDLRDYPGSLLEHYFLHGIFEDRKASVFLEPKWIRTMTPQIEVSGAYHFARTQHIKIPIKPAPAIGPLIDFDNDNFGLAEALNYFDSSGSFALGAESKISQQIMKASKIDPSIKVVDPHRSFTFMPFNSDLFFIAKVLKQAVGKADILIFRDAINFGGADAVLSNLIDSIYRNAPDARIKVIVLGNVDRAALDIHSIDESIIVDLDKIILNQFSSALRESLKPEIVYDVIIGSQAKKIINLNCGSLWSVYEKYGKQLSTLTQLHGYMFCDDRDEFGNVDGYPSRYFLSTVNWLTSLVCDSKYLKSELLHRMANSSVLEKKIHVAETPVSFEELPIPIMNADNIVWAGRFDKQKRPDLVIGIAKALPNKNFFVWGKSVLSQFDESQFEMLPNVKLMGTFDDIEEIQSVSPSLFLYTSEWDGIPTILLKVMSLKIPIIASDVGGVSELVPKECLVKENSVDSFLSAISSFTAFSTSDVSKILEHYSPSLKARSAEHYDVIIRRAIFHESK